MAEIESRGGGGVKEHAVTPAAHEERNGFIHAVMLDPMSVVGPQDDLLTALIETGERFPAAEDLLVVGQSEGSRELASVFGGGASETKRKGVGIPEAFVIFQVNGLSDQ
jgi:hypothetical protein